MGSAGGLGCLTLPASAPLEEGEATLPKPRVLSRIRLKSLERVCVDPDAPWVKKLLQDLPNL